MLSFDIRSIETRAIDVEGDLDATDPVWEEGDNRPDAAVRVTGRLQSAGVGRFYFSGQVSGSVSGECRRCLAPVSAAVSEETHVFFADAGADETDDPDVYVLDPRNPELDLRPAMREQWLLAVPAWHLCRDDCKGLCPTCGADLNAGPCDCTPAADPRWAALRAAPRGAST
ncbi:MAG: DUF177 domain-containing protein [Gemmatimonadetes bacterium]|nr:DUF177 domain-containing protein [Gemmatimonadota bacterium]